LQAYRQGDFVSVAGNLGRGIGQGEVWLAFTVDTQEHHIHSPVLEVAPAFLDRVEVYVTAHTDTTGAQLRSLGVAGDTVIRTPEQGETKVLPSLHAAFALDATSPEATTVLIHIRTTSTMAAIVTLYAFPEFLNHVGTQDLVLGVAIAIAGLIVLLALVLTLVQRKVIYLLWLGLVGNTSLLWFALDGVVYRFFTFVGSGTVNTLVSSLSLLGFAFFSLLISSLFDIRRHARWLDGGLRITAGVLMCSGGGLLLGMQVIPSIVHLVISPLLVALVVYFSYRALVGQWHMARVYVPSLMVFLIMNTYNLIANFGWVSYGWMALYGGQVMGVFNMLLLQWSFYDEIRQRNSELQDERLKLTQQLMVKNHELEVRVAARTQDLEQALAHVKTSEGRQRQLLSMASHEFRTPAAVIKASLDSLVYLKKQIAPEVAHRLDNMRLASKRMTELANDLISQDRLDVYRQGNATSPIQIKHIQVAQLLENVASTYPDSSWLHMAHIPSDLWTEADPALLTIALNNLILNAHRHGHGDERGIWLQARVENACLHLEVSDLGDGVPDADKAHIFEPYITQRHPGARVPPRVLDNQVGQTGLGLSIVRAIARDHQGMVTVRDNTPHGSIFTISLPLMNPRQSTADF
jgi:signal transduction histidine kinase